MVFEVGEQAVLVENMRAFQFNHLLAFIKLLKPYRAHVLGWKFTYFKLHSWQFIECGLRYSFLLLCSDVTLHIELKSIDCWDFMIDSVCLWLFLFFDVKGFDGVFVE